MKFKFRSLLVLLCLAVFLRPGNSCGPFFDEDVFALQSDPDAPYAKFVDGHLGLLQREYRIRHMVVAYNTLSGRSLSPAERKAALDVDAYYNNTDASGKPFGELGEGERKVPGNDWQTFRNCLDDAQANADRTLADRRARYGKPGAPDPPEIADWEAGQEAVFSNCSGAGRMPQPASANAPPWLKQDRTYQIAAAQFYALDYDAALASFRAIAADHASPWAPLARYLVARTLIRRVVVPYKPFYFGSSQQPTQEQIEARKADVRAGLAQARDQLVAILHDPAMKPLHSASSHLLDYVMARLDPTAQADVLARRLTASKPANTEAAAHDYMQNVIDLGYIYNTLPTYANWTPYQEAQAHQAAPLIRWLDDLGRPRPAVAGVGTPENAAGRIAALHTDALAEWRTTHELQWLVAALAIAQPGRPENDDLMSAARTVPATSPAYAMVTYHRLRIASAAAKPGEAVSAETKPVYAELAALMSAINKSQPRSTVNTFADLASGLAPTLNDFLRDATRIAAAFGSDEEGPETSMPAPAATAGFTLCGVAIYASDAQHLDDQTALIFNQRMPLHMLRESALSTALPNNVRFQLAHMAWTRALLLDDAQTARALTPYLSGCQPAIASWLNHYNAASSAEERHVLGLLAMMRFTSTEPTVRAGIERDFASYSGYRDNWWGSVDNQEGYPAQQGPPKPHLFGQPITPRLNAPDPPFLTAADRAQVDEEIARLQKIPCASDYFALQTLAWVNDHPDDSHNADLIGFAMRVIRNAARSKDTKELNHQLFDLIHRRFPSSEWARRYTTWE